VLADAPDFRALVEEVLEKTRRRRPPRGPLAAELRRGARLGVTATPAEGGDGRFLGAVALFST
jgi:hypothetical protein